MWKLFIQNVFHFGDYFHQFHPKPIRNEHRDRKFHVNLARLDSCPRDRLIHCLQFTSTALCCDKGKGQRCSSYRHLLSFSLTIGLAKSVYPTSGHTQLLTESDGASSGFLLYFDIDQQLLGKKRKKAVFGKF
jgi:hypothetical protein